LVAAREPFLDVGREAADEIDAQLGRGPVESRGDRNDGVALAGPRALGDRASRKWSGFPEGLRS